MMRRAVVLAALGVQLFAGASFAGAQEVSKETVNGIRNFARLGTTVACTGATTPEAMVEVKRLGFVAVVNLREASEAGSNIDAETAAATSAGLRYVHLPLNATTPDPAVVDRFLVAIAEPANQPALIHCASGNRAAAVWMVKRMVVDKWTAEKAGEEAAALGLTSEPLKKFVLSYVSTRAGRLTP